VAYFDYTDPLRAPTPRPTPQPEVVRPVKMPASTPVTSTIPRWLTGKFATLVVLQALTLGIVAWDHLPQFPHPGPGPGPGPIPGPVIPEPLRVIFIYESSDPLSREQNNILNSPAIRSYLTSHCLKDGDLPAWRYWDKDINVSKESAAWQAAWNSAKVDPTPLPKIVIFTKTAMVAYPLPADEQATLDLLKKYGGQ
jgi:hypothetical protein